MFLLRRNLPLAWAGWYDTFDSYGIAPLRQPWNHLGDGTPADYNALNELHIPPNYLTNNGGGESYEFQPFTPNWGLEFEVWWPVEGLAAQSFTCFITDSWARVGALFQNLVGIQLRHTSGGDTIGVNQYANIIGFNDHEGQWSAGAAYLGRSATVRVWVENDEWVRVWLDGVYKGSFTTNATFKLGPDRRCVRFLNAALCNCWMRWIDHYDRTASIPPKTVWTSVRFDDFNRADGAPANGWTQVGANASIVAGAWAHITGNDGSVGLLWNTGNTSGKVRVEGTVKNPNNTSDQGLMACVNDAYTQGLTANIFSGKVYLSRFSSLISGNPPTFTTLQALTSGVSVVNGDKVAFSVHNGIGWIEINGVPRLYAGDVHGVVPAANTWAGARVSRGAFVDSGAWDDLRIYSGV